MKRQMPPVFLFLALYVFLTGSLSHQAEPYFEPGTLVTLSDNRVYKIIKGIGYGGYSNVYEVEETVPPHRRKAMKVFYEKEENPALRPETQRFYSDPSYQKARHLLVYEPLTQISSTTKDGITTRAEKATMLAPLVFPILNHGVKRNIRETLSPEQLAEYVEFVYRVGEQGMNAMLEMHATKHGHRDIKPPNIALTGLYQDFMAGKAEVVFVDFDLVTAVDGPLESGIAGTPAYMAPEIWRKHGYSLASADAFAFCASLLFMLTGEVPAKPPSIQDIVDEVFSGKQPSYKERLGDAQIELGMIGFALSAHASRDTVNHFYSLMKLIGAAMDEKELNRPANLEHSGFPRADELANAIRTAVDYNRPTLPVTACEPVELMAGAIAQ